MPLYVLQVYRGASYYPDRNLHSRSRGRLDRRAQQLEREGFHVIMIAVTPEGRSPPP